MLGASQSIEHRNKKRFQIRRAATRTAKCGKVQNSIIAEYSAKRWPVLLIKSVAISGQKLVNFHPVGQFLKVQFSPPDHIEKCMMTISHHEDFYFPFSLSTSDEPNLDGGPDDGEAVSSKIRFIPVLGRMVRRLIGSGLNPPGTDRR